MEREYQEQKTDNVIRAAIYGATEGVGSAIAPVWGLATAAQVEEVNRKVDSLEQKVDSLEQDMNKRFDAVDKRIGALTDDVTLLRIGMAELHGMTKTILANQINAVPLREQTAR